MRRYLFGLLIVLLVLSCFVSMAETETGTTTPIADNAGTTAEIDVSTVLEDGIYVPDAFSWTGGTGRLKGMDCTQISVRDGMTYATIVLQSGKYSYLKANGGIYPCEMTSSTSTAEIPIKLNVSNRILGCTLAMTAPHEVEYSICVELELAKNGNEDSVSVGGIMFEADPEACTQLLKVYHAGDADLIGIEGVGYYFVTDDEANAANVIKNEAAVIIRPVTNAYIAAPELIDTLMNGSMSGIGMVSENTAENAALSEAIESGKIQSVGRLEEADYKALVMGGCDLAVAAGTDITEEIKEYFDMLGITLFCDRSAEETNAEDSAKWSAVYQLIFNFEEDDE